MLYHYNGDSYKLINENGLIKLYHKAVNKWSSGWTYIGIYKNKDLAEAAARKYTT